MAITLTRIDSVIEPTSVVGSLADAHAILGVLAAFSPDQIADLFAAAGIGGFRKDSMRCPVANYLTKHLGGWAVVTGTILWGDAPGPVARLVAPAPSSVRMFIAKFDRGAYPHLDREIFTTVPTTREYLEGCRGTAGALVDAH